MLKNLPKVLFIGILATSCYCNAGRRLLSSIGGGQFFYRKLTWFPALVGISLLSLFLPMASFAAQPAHMPLQEVKAAEASVSATVGQYYLSLSGYIAPYASVVLTSDGVVLRSTVADAQGNFFISQVLIKAGFSHFCLDAIDYRRLGESEACFTVAPASASISKQNIFLPPTLGLQRTDVNVGDSALAWGYSMPGASVTVHLDADKGCTVTADNTGYYQCTIKIAKAGTHELYADATLKGKPSEPQLKKVIVKGLSITQQVEQKTNNALQNLWNLLTGLPGGLFLLLVLLLIILIIILIIKLKYPEWLPKVGVPSFKVEHVFDFLFKERKLHHAWFVGY